MCINICIYTRVCVYVCVWVVIVYLIGSCVHWVVWLLAEMNFRGRCIFPKYFRRQLEPASGEQIMKWQRQWRNVYICINSWSNYTWERYFRFLCFNGTSTFVGYLMPKLFSYCWGDKEVHTFPKSICSKVNVIAQLEYELAYYDSAVHRFNHYTTRTPSDIFGRKESSQ